MTEAGQKWAVNAMSAITAHYPVKRAEEILRAFCYEVEKRARAIGSGQSDPHSVGRAFDELKRELLGEK